VEQWHPTDLSFTSTTTYANPFQNVSISAKFTGPGGITLTVPGFYAGSQTWKVRFSPTAVGSWSYTTTSSDSQMNGKTGTITCVANGNTAVHGTLKVDSNHKHYFVYEDGTPYFLMSFEADWLGLMDFGDTNVTKAKSLVDIYRSHGFNGVLMNIYGYDTTWDSGHTSSFDFGPPAQYPWLGSNSSPDQSQMNTAFFDNLDRVIDYLFQNGITAHLFFKVNNKGVTWPTEGSADEKLYFTYVTARYQAYPNMIWDFEKEAKNESGGNTYVNNSLVTIKNSDAYHRLTTVHDDMSYYSAFPNTCDFQTIQRDGLGTYSSLITDRNTKNWPVFEGEYDYQIGNDGGHTYSVVQSQALTLTDTLECFMAGCAANYYYTYHSWDVVRYSETPNGLSAYQNAVNFFKGTVWSSLAPNDGLINSAGVGRHCLAAPGSEYVVYLSGSGSATVTIAGAPSGNSLAATWVDIATGATQTLANTGNGSKTFTNPWSDPALLHLTSTQTAPPTPTGLTATAGDNQVALSWNASSGATSYNVKRSTTSGSGYATIASPTTASYTDTTVANGTTYYYVVSAVNGGGESANSSQVSATPKSGPPPVPTGLTPTAGNNQVALSWNASSGATSYNVKRSTTSGSGYATIASPTTTSYTDTTAVNGTTYYYVVSAVNGGGESANSSQVSATPATTNQSVLNPDFELPGLGKISSGFATIPGWANAGTTYTDSGVETSPAPHGGSYSAYCKGSDSGAYQIVNYQMNAGDTITLTWWAEHSGGTGTSTQAVSLVSASALNAAYTATTTLANNNAALNGNGSSAGPWAQYTLTYQATTADAGNYVGIYFNNATAANWAGFDDFSLTVAPLLLPSPWATTDIGAVGVAGSATYTNGLFTVSGSGADIWGTADAFQFVYQPASGDCSIQAKVLTVQNTQSHAKGGVMIRETLNANSTMAMVDLTPGNGAEFIWRTNTAAGAAASSVAGLTAPNWVKVTRTGNSFVGYYSTNGTAWSAMGTNTITMATSVYIGLPVCAHNNTTNCTATFTNVLATP
jgi:hypothetical protein